VSQLLVNGEHLLLAPYPGLFAGGRLGGAPGQVVPTAAGSLLRLRLRARPDQKDLRAHLDMSADRFKRRLKLSLLLAEDPSKCPSVAVNGREPEGKYVGLIDHRL